MNSILRQISWIIRYPRKYYIFQKCRNHSMFGHPAFITNLLLSDTVHQLDGSIVECGTWRGGMSAGFSLNLGKNRKVFLFDSFEGLPDVTKKDGEKAKEYQIQTKFDPTGAEFEIIKGWFDDTIPNFNKDMKIALLHLDGDWYDSTMVCLENFYDKVVPGGIIILDDYTNWEGCTKAVNDFLSKNDLGIAIRQYNNLVSYFVKP
jgi:O-methyltransferase